MELLLKFAPYIAVVAIGAVAALLFVLFDNRREVREDAAIDVAAELKSWGLGWLAGVFRCYAIQDYSGIAKAVYDVVQIVTDPPTLMLKLKDVARKMATHAATNDPAFADELRGLLVKPGQITQEAPATKATA